MVFTNHQPKNEQLGQLGTGLMLTYSRILTTIDLYNGSSPKNHWF